MTIRITAIEPKWFEQKACVQSRAWKELNQGVLPQELVDIISPEFALKLTIKQAEDPNQITLIALDDEKVIGFADFLHTPRPPIERPEAAELASLYVLNAYHGRGIGRLLLETGMHAIGNDCIALYVADFNANAQGFYTHMGFHTTDLRLTEDIGDQLEMINY